jgi:hypothetical protein
MGVLQFGRACSREMKVVFNGRKDVDQIRIAETLPKKLNKRNPEITLFRRRHLRQIKRAASTI